MVRESKLWKLLKKNTPQIQWTRLESWASFGVPDLLGYNDKCGFFMVELKVASGNKISFSPHQKLFHYTRTKRNFILVQIPSLKCIKLFKSSSLPGLLARPPRNTFPRNRMIGITFSACCSSPPRTLDRYACSLARLVGLPTHPPCLLARSFACSASSRTLFASWPALDNILDVSTLEPF